MLRWVRVHFTVMRCPHALTEAMMVQGYEHAKRATLAFLDTFKEKADPDDRELLRCVARTSLRTKLYEDLADQLTDIVVDAVLTIRKPEEAIDLFMVCNPPQQHHCWQIA